MWMENSSTFLDLWPVSLTLCKPTKYCVIFVLQEVFPTWKIKKETFSNSWLWLHHGPRGFSILATFVFSVFPRTFPVQLTSPVAAFGYHSLPKSIAPCVLFFNGIWHQSLFYALYRHDLKSKSTDRICRVVTELTHSANCKIRCLKSYLNYPSPLNDTSFVSMMRKAEWQLNQFPFKKPHDAINSLQFVIV